MIPGTYYPQSFFTLPPNHIYITHEKIIVFAGAFFCIGINGTEKSQSQKFAETITAADLKTHLSIVASAEMEGRETATEGQRKAAAYIENHFKTLGFFLAIKEVTRWHTRFTVIQ